MATGGKAQMDDTGAGAEGGTLMDVDDTTTTTIGGECSTEEEGLEEGEDSGSEGDDKESIEKDAGWSAIKKFVREI